MFNFGYLRLTTLDRAILTSFSTTLVLAKYLDCKYNKF